MSSTLTYKERVAAVTKQLAERGISNPGVVNLDLPTPKLYEQIIARGEGQIAHGGSVVVETGIYTGRSAKDKFIVEEPTSQADVDWGTVNRPVSQENYEKVRGRLMAFLQGRELFVQDVRVGADPQFQRRVRVVNIKAWQNLFARNLFITPETMENEVVPPDFTVIACPDFKADPELDGTRSEAFIYMNIAQREIIIGGTAYAGEMKKSIFSIMNYLLPKQAVFPMHCSANIGTQDDVAIFFGLSGTGKTTLSTDPKRRMIGDDEHGWSDKGVFNFEGGCYAKTIRLNAVAEPVIHNCTQTFGTVLENVVMDEESRTLDLDDDRKTENTRAAYPLSSVGNIKADGMGGHPSHVILLTADAFGVLPPVSRLTSEQAMYHFISGYTAKLAGTERGVKEPQATFSSCFGGPFMVHHPTVYAEMLGKRLSETGAKCWLVNTGWTAGPYGEGHRMPIRETRAIIDSILANELNDVATHEDPVFGLAVPTAIDGVETVRLTPRDTWKDGAAFDAKAKDLARQFNENFANFADRVSDAIKGAGPKV
ncbi:Phosphoenolpyruvate carboxykinase (ATP) [Magnetococcus marinus MC-1]|uniref:Phosphoenolpyruvate carboxykinase (ATP) n=1 Tax=Magnetococcus marinus (strain ATCC BAA-1437 / JCM 17883 / MC-1) TaxID=156889 RepID=A0L4K2_MAGMM|nr:phosphoenolpyruvate carboxykinase (ATP) [Magnetococcus marinus]ABK42895.1 Phosphoenolpyruvate carboxykinase (ATP) [Magnetococcus marinus MC-1]